MPPSVDHIDVPDDRRWALPPLVIDRHELDRCCYELSALQRREPKHARAALASRTVPISPSSMAGP